MVQNMHMWYKMLHSIQTSSVYPAHSCTLLSLSISSGDMHEKRMILSDWWWSMSHGCQMKELSSVVYLDFKKAFDLHLHEKLLLRLGLSQLINDQVHD